MTDHVDWPAESSRESSETTVADDWDEQCSLTSSTWST